MGHGERPVMGGESLLCDRSARSFSTPVGGYRTFILLKRVELDKLARLCGLFWRNVAKPLVFGDFATD